jgi:hypothetical protein
MPQVACGNHPRGGHFGPGPTAADLPKWRVWAENGGWSSACPVVISCRRADILQKSPIKTQFWGLSFE